MTSHLPPSVSEGLPPWRVVDLPGRGPLRIRDSGAPPGGVVNAPVVLLLHGWTVSADLNWCRTYEPIARRARVVAWDQRGHGAGGLRTPGRMRMEALADDAAAVVRALGVGRATAVGYSMGGGIVVNYQLQSDLAGFTSGLILDAPMLNFGRTVDKGAEERSVPPPITAAAKFFSALRFGVDWGALDFLSHADEMTVPILLFHGDTDDTVPIETSIEFADLAPDLVELHTFADAGHVQGWNYFTDEYEFLVTEFIERVR